VIEVLNSLGECYFKIDDKEKALRACEKSLEINPKQENIKKMIEKLKESRIVKGNPQQKGDGSEEPSPLFFDRLQVPLKFRETEEENGATNRNPETPSLCP
jgi:tetratricopeptide (TPR) repeat protein